MFERDFINLKHQFIGATDEVGRGPLAGPVVSACVLVGTKKSELKKLTTYLRELGVTDSKKLSDKKREKILELLDIKVDRSLKWVGKLCGINVSISIDKKTPRKIDQINILQASLESMRDAFIKIQDADQFSVVLVDGNKCFRDVSQTDIVPIIKGDSKSSLIGLASIVAKVYRDRLMKNYAKKYPFYNFEKNAGYPTAAHRKAIEVHGITPIHRKSFRGVKEYVGEQRS